MILNGWNPTLPHQWQFSVDPSRLVLVQSHFGLEWLHFPKGTGVGFLRWACFLQSCKAELIRTKRWSRFIKIRVKMSQPLFPNGNLIWWVVLLCMSCFLCRGHSCSVLMQSKMANWRSGYLGSSHGWEVTMFSLWNLSFSWCLTQAYCSKGDFFGWLFLLDSQILSLKTIESPASRKALDGFIPLCLGIPIF